MRQHDVGDDVGHGRLTTPNLHFLFRKRLTGKPTRANPHTQNTFSKRTQLSALQSSLQPCQPSVHQPTMDGSALMGDADDADLESLVQGWSQPA